MADQRDITLQSLAGTPTDILLYELPVAALVSTVIYLSPFDATPSHILLSDPTSLPSGSVFPTQYSGFRVYDNGAAFDLCLVATADAPTGMGGQLRLRNGATTYAFYLVETSDGDASTLLVPTTTGVKAIRRKT